MTPSQHPKTDAFFELIKDEPIDENELVIRCSKLIRMCKDFERGHNRYEKVRMLTPTQFDALWMRSMTDGIPFDDLVDWLE